MTEDTTPPTADAARRQLVKQLHEATSLSPLKCWRALEETKYDYAKAYKLLLEQNPSQFKMDEGRP